MPESGCAAVRESTPWGVPDLRWDHVRRWFNRDDNGLLPDGCVPGTTVADWQAVLALVRSRGWAYEYSEDGRVAGCRRLS